MSKELEKFYHPVREVYSLKDMINSSAELFSESTAFLVKEEKGGKYKEIKYKKFKEDIDALGTSLMDLGLTGEKIAIIGENCYEWVVAYFAVTNGAGIVVPLDKELSTFEIHNLLDTAKCKAIFYTNTYKPTMNDYHIDYKINMGSLGKMDSQLDKGELFIYDLVSKGKELLLSGKRDFLDAAIDENEMKIILFTSGTTDIAKGVMLSNKNIMSDVMDTCRIVDIKESDVSLSILPIHHTFESSLGIILMLYRGASIAFCEGLKYISKNVVEARATMLIGVPLIFESIYDKIWKQAEKQGKDKTLKKAIKLNRAMKSFGIDISRKLFKSVHEKFGGRLRLIVTGAAAIDPNVCRGFEDLGIKVVQGYGLTECSPLVAGCTDFGNTFKKAGSVGPAIPSGEIKIIDKDEDGIGEIIFKGPNVMLGYYNLPEKTAEVLKEGWFYTGDLGFLDKDEWLYITGRKKNVIVTKTGKNIYPEEVEYYINRNKYIEASLVHGVLEDENNDTSVGAQIRPAYDVIYEEFGKDFDEADIYTLIKKIIGEINEKLPIYKRIRNFSVRKEDFERTTTKKIKRHKN
ncbi:MAG: AMP-binding protein [Eubacteriales bacterium]